MWWLLEKYDETEKAVSYKYGFQTVEKSGLIIYDKTAEDFFAEISKGDNERKLKSVLPVIEKQIKEKIFPKTIKVATS